MSTYTLKELEGMCHPKATIKFPDNPSNDDRWWKPPTRAAGQNLPPMQPPVAVDISRDDRIRQQCAELAEILIKKDKDYGDSNIKKFGVFGVLVRLSDKVERLLNLKQKVVNYEAEADSWLDAAGYSVIGLMLKKGTW